MGGIEGRAGRRGAGRSRRERLFIWFSLFSAFVVAGSVLLLSGSLTREQSPVETIAQPPVAEPPVVEPPSLTRTPPDFDPELLRARLQEIAEDHEGVYGVVVLEPISGTEISLRGDEQFMAASIGKLPVFATLYREAARGGLDLEEEISILPEDIQDYGSGELQSFPEDYSLSLRECAYRLVNHSDNTAWAMLDRRLGEERVRAELEEMGAEDSLYSGHLSPYLTTPNDVLRLLQNISDPEFTSEELSGEMLEAMTGTSFEDRILASLPPDVRVAHKTGSYEDNFGDAGIVFYRDRRGVAKRYYLVVLATGTGAYDVQDTIQSMSLTVYETLADAGGDLE